MLGNVVKWKIEQGEYFDLLLFQFFPHVCVCFFCSFQHETGADSDWATAEKMLYKIKVVYQIKPSNISVSLQAFTSAGP